MRAFCKQYDAPVEAIITECGVFEPVALNAGKERPKGKRVSNAMWDTGSTDTLISSAIVKELNLQPIDTISIGAVNGEVEAKVYKIHLVLPNNMVFPNLEVIETKSEDYDVIIGMNIISTMDFALTLPNSQSKFTFEFPSKRDIDFTKD